MHPHEILVDVISLSEQQCAAPIQGRLMYATEENFIGRLIAGYHPDAQQLCLLNRQAAYALCEVQKALVQQHQLGLYVFDGFRPLRAVRDFTDWFNAPIAGQQELDRKALHYPHLEKSALSDHGYVAANVSRHCYGFAIDLGLIDLSCGELLDMGCIFDYFDELAHTTATADEIGERAYANRQLLAEVMQSQQFMPYKNEYWHFDFHINEADEPMDLEITPDVKGLNVSI